MPSPPSGKLDAARRHIAAVQSHREFAEFLRGSGRDDPVTVGWAITALFYASVHAVRAYLTARHGESVTAHQDMYQLYRSHPELKRTQDAYDLLKQKSEGARYYAETFVWKDFENLLQDARKVESTWLPKANKAIADAASAPKAP